MKKSSIFFSILFATAGFFLCFLNGEAAAGTPIGCVLWTAEVFAVMLAMGYLGLEFSLFINRKKFTAVGRRSIIVSLLLSILLSSVTGAVGQILFAVEKEKFLKTPEDVKDTGIVFMMDCSASMDHVYKDCIEASCDLVDSLNESCYYQYVGFSYIVAQKTDLLQLTDSNKEQIKSIVRSGGTALGGTYFNPPLETAYNTLTNEAVNCKNKIAILFSDCISSVGYNSVSDELINLYNSSDIKVYVIMVSYDENETLPQDDPLSKITYETLNVVPDDDGKINIENFKEILKRAVSGTVPEETYETRLVLGTEMLLFSNDASVSEIIIRTLTYAVYAALVGCVYYGFENKKRLLMNFVFGVFAGLLSVVHPVIGVFALIIFSLSAFTDFEIENQELI